MKTGESPTYQRHRHTRTASAELFFAMLLFSSMGAITWAIRGTSGWGGIDGTIVPGMTWGVLWWYVCWRKGIDARGVPLWLGLGIALGGELGYGQYVSWIRGMFNVGDQIQPVQPWIGYAWFSLCGVGWGATGGIALGWALSGKKSLGVWLARLALPVGCALLARLAVQTCPWLFFPNWHLGVYVAAVGGGVDPSAAANMQGNMTLFWAAGALLSVLVWVGHKKVRQPEWIARGLVLCGVGLVIVMLLRVAQWLFFPQDQLGLFAGELGRHLGRTVYTNSQNAIVVAWWLGALMVAALQRDRHTLFVGLVIGLGFGIGFPLAAVWCLGYEYAPGFIDWWKMWELQAGFHLGLLYVAVLFWSIRQVDGHRDPSHQNDISKYRLGCETLSMTLAAYLVIHVMAGQAFFMGGILLGLLYVVALFRATRYSDGVAERRRAISLVYSAFLLVFIMAWGASAQAGILLGLYEADAVDQYAWPWARVALFALVGILIAGAAFVKMHQALRNSRFAFPPPTGAPRISAHLVDLMTFTAVVGAASIWPSKIGVLYACFLGLALFAFNRLNHRLDNIDAFIR